MLQIIIFSLLMFLTLLAVFDILRLCLNDEETTKKRLRLWSTPYEVMKNKLKGMRELKEEPANPAPEPKVYSISETV